MTGPHAAAGPEQAATAAGEYACARAWAALTAAHTRIAGQLSSALARACDLSINDFEILLRLDHAPAPGLRLSELNAAIPLTQPSLSRAVARLAQRGWLSRAGAADDRRGVLITITPAGKDVLRSAVPVHAQTIRESLLDPLTPREQDLLARALAERITAIADASGLDLVGIQDHPYNDGFTDTLALITWLAARTSHVHLFPNVANLPLRPPAILAKQAATIDVLSAGRFELGLGAGAFADGIAGMGGPRRSAGQARGALSEAIDIIRASWAGEPYSYQGSYYQVPGARPGPRPAHDIGLWLGVVGPRAIQLVGAKADGWSVSAPYVPPDRLPELNQIITSAARDAGRDPAAITRLYNVMGLITPQDRDAFNGPVERWAETLTALHTESQMNAFVFWPTGDRERQSRLFAEQVVPAARESLS